MWQMLVYATYESSIEAVQTNLSLTKYVHGWGRDGDMGIVAMGEQHPIGAAWCRLWTSDNKGYGYLDSATPELAIAILPDFRGQSIGTIVTKNIVKYNIDQI